MKQQDIQQLLSALGDAEHELVETHISWVLLGPRWAYKIKKPVRFDFLDFSSLAQRKYYCERELQLNRRLSEGIYRAVLPVRHIEAGFHLEGEGETVDYAVQMKRLDSQQRMDLRLEAGKVGVEEMQQLARQLSAFHREAEQIRQPLPAGQQFEDFADLRSAREPLEELLGQEAGERLEESVAQAEAFLEEHANRMEERHALGFVVDGHGDLHGRNIFLLDPPVIFDCIEFDDEKRHIDILDELAFLCMDLEYHEQPQLERALLRAYRARYEVFQRPEDWQLFHYYKCYRANVRLKVNLLSAGNSASAEDALAGRIRQFWALYQRLMAILGQAPSNLTLV